MALIKIILKDKLPNATVVEAVNGKQAVEKFKEGQFSLVFLDVQMPELDGFETAKEIRRLESGNRYLVSGNRSDTTDHRLPTTDYSGVVVHSSPFGGRGAVPIIALTASALQGEKEKCLAAGMSDFVSKPIAKNAIDAVMRKWLAY